jgi:UTP--glucose-1-phosphate uridylyltransferase
LKGAKSALEVNGGLTFLDLTVQQVEHVNATYHVDVPLLLMTSFNTHEDTIRIIKKYTDQQVPKVRIRLFTQSKYPRINKDTLLPCPKNIQESKAAWYPPGHGDLYYSLYRSGMLDQLLREGKRYLFVSNSDNLGAVFVTSALGWLPLTHLFVPSQRRSSHTPTHDSFRIGIFYGSYGQDEG